MLNTFSATIRRELKARAKAEAARKIAAAEKYALGYAMTMAAMLSPGEFEDTD